MASELSPVSHGSDDDDRILLAGDIGGTKVALGLYSERQGPRAPLAKAQFPSQNYASLGSILHEFLKDRSICIERACFAVAGPVIGGRAEVTNLPWVIAEDELAQEIPAKSVHLMNDLVAIGRAIMDLQPTDLHTLNTGSPVGAGAIAVVAPGTGLGEAFLVWDGTRYEPCPSEGGHADFAPTTEMQAGLLAHLARELDHVSVERVCSGPGIINIYEYLRSRGDRPESPDVARALAADPDSASTITAAALRRPDPDPLSAMTLEMFVSILGAEAGNFALKVMSTGGLYLAGGIPMKILPALADGAFMRAFTAKGRLTDLLSRMPVHVVMRRAALLGAALRGFELGSAGTEQ